MAGDQALKRELVEEPGQVYLLQSDPVCVGAFGKLTPDGENTKKQCLCDLRRPG